jgi:hypothetical protein
MRLSPNHENNHLSVNSDLWIKTLGALIILLTLLHLAGTYSVFFLGHRYVLGLIDLLHFDYEQNIPTFFSTLQLLLASSLLFLISAAFRQAGRSNRQWFFLALVFLFLAFDEFASFHESLIVPLRTRFNTGGLLHWPWIIPYGIGTIILGLIYFRFWSQLPSYPRKMIFLAGFLYIFGSIGIESLGGFYVEQNGNFNLTYTLITTLEELLEMTGIYVFIIALLKFIEDELPNLEIRFKGLE